VHVASLAMVYPDDAHELFVLSPTGTVVGRTEACEIRVEREAVSRRHARFGLDHDGWFVEDLDSTNGVYVNDVAARRAVLSERDLVRIGSIIFKFIAGADVATSPNDTGGSNSGAPLQPVAMRAS